MNPNVQVVLDFVRSLFSDLLGPGEHHRDEHPSRHGILLALIVLVMLGLLGILICDGFAYRQQY